MARAAHFAFLMLTVACLLPVKALAQGETTSAIIGEVRDATNAVVSGATVTITSPETGLRRSAKTDDAGRFNFPQLKPGTYSVRAEAQGFESQQNNNVISDLGQKQTVDFTLNVARTNEAVEVNSEAPIINPENANTSTTLDAPALEDLPNAGGDLTYPLQFAPGALINTAGSSNDFVGGTNGYGNVEFNGLPALSNGYIVDGLETNDPLTNLNSGLSTNLVLGLNSISEVTVNILSYSVDQGRYGASQIDYVTKSGTNQFHGNLYELWNGSLLNAADYFTNATPGNHKPRSTVNHFGGSLGGPIASNRLFFFFDSEWVRIALPIVTPTIVPLRRSNNMSCSNFPRGKQPAAGRASRMRIVCSINICSPSMEIPTAHPPRYWAARLAPPGMVAATGRASRTPATTTNRCRRPESTTTSTRKTRLGFVFRRTPACKPRGRTPSTRSSTRFRRSLSTRWPRDTRTSFHRTW